MSTKKKFTPAEVEALRANPYTEKVSENQISFTLAFKEEFWRLSVEGCTGNIAFRKLGYDPRRESEQRLQNEIIYLQQQMAFLKKLMRQPADTGSDS